MAEDCTIAIGFDFFVDGRGRVIADDEAVRKASHQMLNEVACQNVDFADHLQTAQSAVQTAIGLKYDMDRSDGLGDGDMPDFPEGSDFFLI